MSIYPPPYRPPQSPPPGATAWLIWWLAIVALLANLVLALGGCVEVLS